MAAFVARTADGAVIFHCAVCSKNVNMSQNCSSGNTILLYKHHHPQTQRKLDHLDKHNRTEVQMGRCQFQ